MENFIGRQAQRADIQPPRSDATHSHISATSTAATASAGTTATAALASSLPREAFFLGMKLVTKTRPETAPLILRAFAKGMGFEHGLAKLYQVLSSGDFRRLPTAQALETEITAFLESDPSTQKALVFDTLRAWSRRVAHLMSLPAVNSSITDRAAEVTQVLLKALVEPPHHSVHLEGQLTLKHLTPLLALLNSATSRPGLNEHLASTQIYLTEKHAELRAIANIHSRGVRATWDLPDELWQNRAVAMAVYAVDGDQLEHASEEWKRDPAMVIIAVRENGFALVHAHPEVQDNFDVVLAAVQRNGYALEFASVNRQNDPEIVLAAVKDDPDALEFTNPNIRNNLRIALAAVNRNGMALQLLGENPQNDKSVVMAAVKKNGLALRFAHVNQQNDPEVVLAAVQQNGLALEFAHIDQRNDPSIVMAAILKNSDAFQFAGDEVQNQNWLRI